MVPPVRGRYPVTDEPPRVHKTVPVVDRAKVITLLLVFG